MEPKMTKLFRHRGQPVAADASVPPGAALGRQPIAGRASLQQHHLTLRSIAQRCVSKGRQPVSLWPTLRDAVLRTAPQGEEVGLTSSWRSGPSLIGVTFAETLCRRGPVTNVSLTNVSLPAVEDVVAEILHLEDGGVGPPSGRRSRGTSFVDDGFWSSTDARLKGRTDA
jgi:hypothetical protein